MRTQVPGPARFPPQGGGDNTYGAAADDNSDVEPIRLPCDEMQPSKETEEGGYRWVGEQVEVKGILS